MSRIDIDDIYFDKDGKINLEVIKEQLGKNFENQDSPIQELTFNEAKKVFEEKGIPFESNFNELGLIQEETGLYNNVAYLLSDQNRYAIVGIIRNPEKNSSKDEYKEFNGSILKQINDFLKYYQKEAQRLSEKYGYERDGLGIPDWIFQELLINSLSHRRYNLYGYSFVTIEPEKITFENQSGFSDELLENQILNNAAKPRQSKLHNILAQLGYCSNSGESLNKIFDFYKDNKNKADLKIISNQFKTTVPRITD